MDMFDVELAKYRAKNLITAIAVESVLPLLPLATELFHQRLTPISLSQNVFLYLVALGLAMESHLFIIGAVSYLVALVFFGTTDLLSETGISTNFWRLNLVLMGIAFVIHFAIRIRRFWFDTETFWFWKDNRPIGAGRKP